MASWACWLRISFEMSFELRALYTHRDELKDAAKHTGCYKSQVRFHKDFCYHGISGAAFINKLFFVSPVLPPNSTTDCLQRLERLHFIWICKSIDAFASFADLLVNVHYKVVDFPGAHEWRHTKTKVKGKRPTIYQSKKIFFTRAEVWN